MAERIDHDAEAREFQQASQLVAKDSMEAATLAVRHAQLHATLALVEQQRIANLIALESQRWERHCQVGSYFGPDILRGNPTTELGSAELKPEVAAALGIDLEGDDK